MSHPEPGDLTRAKELIEVGKIEEAFQLVEELERKGNLSNQEQLSCYVLKSTLSSRFGFQEDAVKYAKMAFRECQGLEQNLLQLDIYIEMANASTLMTPNVEEALDFINKAETLFRVVSFETQKEKIKKKATINWVKGFIYNIRGEREKALEYAKEALSLREELDLSTEICLSLLQLGTFNSGTGEWEEALKYMERGMDLAEKVNYKHILPYFLNLYGIYHHFKGELDKAREFYQKGAKIVEETNNKPQLANFRNNMGNVCLQQGEVDCALEELEKSLAVLEEIGGYRPAVLDSLFQLSINTGEYNQARRYLQSLKERKEDDVFAKLMYRVNKAVLLKTSPRARNLIKAEEILKKVVQEEIINYEVTIIALLNLCDIYLIELRNTGDLEILDEVNPYLNQLLNIAEKNHFYLFVCETYLLKARLALLTFDVKEARKFLTQAQNLADTYGLYRLAVKISDEHDELLKQLKTWDHLKKSKASLEDRIEFSNLSEQMKLMLLKKGVESPELTDETPVLLLIISKGGTPLFSNYFTKEWTFEDDLISGFLTAFNSFSDELFSKGLDRAKFGEYTILMQSVRPFSVCYLFKGPSYLAQQKIKHFIDNFQSDNAIWQTFNEYYQSHKLVELKDIPTIEPLITEIFINKNIPLEGNNPS